MLMADWLRPTRVAASWMPPQSITATKLRRGVR
jgi:hypothetical protein